MIKKLQIKFVAITMLATMIITGGIFGLIIFENYRITDGQTDAIINLLVENEGIMPEYKANNGEFSNFITKETEFSTRYFTVEVDSNGNIVDTNMQNIARISRENVNNIIKKVKGVSGYCDNFKYKVIEKHNNKLIIFLDCTMQLASFKKILYNSIFIIIGGWFLVLLMVTLLSKKFLKPITSNIEKQRQFITNASHELKTPLAVVTADIDVLEMTIGEDNEWLESIKNQTNRLNTLIKSLLNLSNIEEKNTKLEKTELSITNVVNKEIINLKPLLQEKTIIFDNSKQVSINADIELIKQLIIILLDNAIKYTENNGTIKIELNKVGKHTEIIISNTCDNVKNVNTHKIFDRFYRDDVSRNKKKEGYGIGLSIAKSIVETHKGKISSYINSENMICFKVVI